MKGKQLIFAVIAALALVPACNPSENPTPGDGGHEGKDPAPTTLSILVDCPVISSDGVSAATFTVLYGEEAVSEGVSFYDGNNVPVELLDMKFTTRNPGKYSFWAAYKTLHTEKIEIVAVNSSVPELPFDGEPHNCSFTKRVLLTQFTGTGCGYCPYMISLLHKLDEDKNYHDKFVLAACHTYNSSDPAYISVPIDGALGVGSYPTVAFNLNPGTRFGNYYSLAGLCNIFDSEYEKPARAGICAVCVSGDGQVVLRAGIKAASEGEYRIAAWLLEDGIKGKQTNNNPEATKGYDYDTHNNCLRDVLGRRGPKDFTGNSYYLKDGESADEFFIFDTKKSWKSENLHAVVFVSAEENGIFYVNNVIDCPIGGSVAYGYSE